MATEEESLALADQLLDMQKRIKQLEAGGRASQLSNSALDLNSGRGYLALMDGVVEKARIGRLPDGTVSVVSVNNNNPPGIPSPARIAPLSSVTLPVTVLFCANAGANASNHASMANNSFLMCIILFKNI